MVLHVTEKNEYHSCSVRSFSYFSTLRIRLRLKCDGTCAETSFYFSAKRTSPFKSAGASVQSTAGSRGVRISGSNAGYTRLYDLWDTPCSVVV